MIWFDIALLGYACYRILGGWCGWALPSEKIAMAFILALASKSLILFFLIRLGIQPIAGIQLLASAFVLVSTFLLPKNPNEEREILPSQKTGLIWITLLGVSGLFVLSMINAWFFPITESDAIWYQIRGMSFFHEVQFDSESVVPQLKQYPPFVPLLFAYLIAFDVGFLKVFFPILFLCLNIIFYSRLLSISGSQKIACLFTMILATTPYFWWHGVLPFLDMTTAVFYSTGTLYWYCWVKSKIDGSSPDKEKSYALASGILFGLAAWTRMEFLLYDLVPIFLTVYVFSRYSEGSSSRDSLKVFFISLLLFPSVWFLNLITFDMVLWSQVKMVAGVCSFLWILAFALVWGRWNISETNVRLVFVFAVLGYFLLLFLVETGPMPVWKKLMISLYRTSVVHIYYLFTASLMVFIFFEKIKSLSEQKKLLGFFLILFLFTHLAIFSYATPKWPTLSEFVYATFIQPGNSVNLSDTRGMMSIYPVFIFFTSLLPFVNRRLTNE